MDRNSYGKFFKLSGFAPEEIHDIECRTKGIKQVLKEQKVEKRIEKKVKNIHKFLTPTNWKRGHRKAKTQKVSQQIQYGFNLVAWWGLQHA